MSQRLGGNARGVSKHGEIVAGRSRYAMMNMRRIGGASMPISDIFWRLIIWRSNVLMMPKYGDGGESSLETKAGRVLTRSGRCRLAAVVIAGDCDGLLVDSRARRQSSNTPRPMTLYWNAYGSLSVDSQLDISWKYLYISKARWPANNGIAHPSPMRLFWRWFLFMEWLTDSIKSEYICGDFVILWHTIRERWEWLRSKCGAFTGRPSWAFVGVPWLLR